MYIGYWTLNKYYYYYIINIAILLETIQYFEMYQEYRNRLGGCDDKVHEWCMEYVC